jgi:hypothetical protein
MKRIQIIVWGLTVIFVNLMQVIGRGVWQGKTVSGN